MMASRSIYEVTLAQVRGCERSAPYIGSRNARMPGTPEGAPRNIEQEITACRTLPREYSRHVCGIVRDQNILVEQVAMDGIPTLRACGQQFLDARFTDLEQRGGSMRASHAIR